MSEAEPVQSLREDFCSEEVVSLWLLYIPVAGIHRLGRGDNWQTNPQGMLQDRDNGSGSVGKALEFRGSRFPWGLSVNSAVL